MIRKLIIRKLKIMGLIPTTYCIFSRNLPNALSRHSLPPPLSATKAKDKKKKGKLHYTLNYGLK